MWRRVWVLIVPVAAACHVVVGPYEGGSERDGLPPDAGPFVCASAFDRACVQAAPVPMLCDEARDACVPPDAWSVGCAAASDFGGGRQRGGPLVADVVAIPGPVESEPCVTTGAPAGWRIEGAFFDLEEDAPTDAAEADFLIRWRVEGAVPTHVGPLTWTPQREWTPGRFSQVVCGSAYPLAVAVQILDTQGNASNVACSP